MATGRPPKERRRSDRYAVNREFVGGADTFVSELSEHGLFLHTRQRVPVGTQVALRFTLLLDDPVRVEAVGTVVRHQDDPPGMGITFGELDPVTVLRLSDALARLRPRPLGPPLRRAAAGEAGILPTTPVAARPVKTRRKPPTAEPSRSADRDKAPDVVDEDEKTLIRLKPVDMEIVEDDEDGFFDES